MPTQLSKFSINSTCHEVIHPWTNSCISATAGLGLHSIQECLKIYSTVYFVTLLMKGKKPSKDDIKKTISGILQSTAFLSWSAFTLSFSICCLRRILGNFNILSVSYIPSFFSCLSAIIIERPSRRPLLCLYVSNIATETLFKMGVWRGYWKPIKFGNVYIFATSMAMLLYYYRCEEIKKDSIFRIIKFIASPYEDPTHNDHKNIPINNSNKHTDAKKKIIYKNKKSLSIIWKSLKVYQYIITWIKSLTRHSTCPHPHSCIHFIIEGTSKLFGIGLGVQLSMKIIFQLQKLIKQPKLIKTILFKKNNFNLALFLGGFTGFYRLMTCLLRRTFDKDSKYHAIPSGLVAGAAFAMFPNNTVALYVMWKSLQLYWNRGVEKGYLPEYKWFVIVLYSLSTAVLLHAAIVEPQNLRSSYWKFLYNLSGGRIASMSRVPLDEFGLSSSKCLQDVLKATNTTDIKKYSF